VCVWSSPLCRVAQEESNKNLVCYFWTFLQVSMNFGSLNYFYYLKQIETVLKPRAQCWARSNPGLWHTGRGSLPRTVARQSRGPRPGGPVQRGKWPVAVCHGARQAHSRRGHLTQSTLRTARWHACRWPDGS
jgi:hypothetical protein